MVRKHTRAKIAIVSHNAIEHEASAWKKWASKKVLGQAHRVLVHSSQDKATLRQMLPAGTEIVQTFHPSYADLCPTRLERDEARAKLGLSGPTLLFFGFVREYKGLDILLKAMPGVLKERPEVNLLVVGEFWKDKDNYLRQIKDLGLEKKVRVIDEYIPNEDMSLYFGAADLVVQPYRSATGSGIAQLAYGFDRPVVGTDVGSLSEVIEDGANGRLVPPRDSAALAKAIVESLAPDNLAKMNRNAALTKERFSWAEMTRQLTAEGDGPTEETSP